MAGLDLAAPFAPQTPAQQLGELAKYAEEQGADEADLYGDGKWIQDLEGTVASDLGKPAGAFFVSGIMAQQCLLKVYQRNVADPAGKVDADLISFHPTSHLEVHEQNSYVELLHMRARLVGERGRALCLADVEAAFSEGRLPHTLVVELPQREDGGVTPTWEELTRLRAWCTEHKVKMHLDGARLWEVQPFYERSRAEIVALFDSAYVSFYKGIGGMVGAMLVGSADDVAAARIWRRRFGGTVFTQFPAVLSARMCYDRHVDSFKARADKLRSVVADLTALSPRFRFQPAVPTSCFVHFYIRGSKESIIAARDAVRSEHGIMVSGNMRGVFEEECYWEWKMGPANMVIPNEEFVRGWKLFLSHFGEQP
eukprot:Hpha_TRINITY_DN14965_c1_g4::TRINITY_DN14965_c1_g4_i1::g.144034::m.144034